MAIEIEKKFLLVHFPDALMTDGIRICQGYISTSENGVVRARLFGDQGFLAIKGPTSVNGARKEFEYPVPPEDAREMLSLFCGNRMIEKTRFHIDYKGHEWVVDQFRGSNTGLVVAEIELETMDQPFQKPDWIGQEVTRDPRYFNSNLIDHPYSSWTASP